MRSDRAREALKASPPGGRRSDKAQRAGSPDNRCCAHGLLHAVCCPGHGTFCTAQLNPSPSRGRRSDEAQHAQITKSK